METSVLRRAREIAADLVVAGTHGRSALRRFLLGSVGEELARVSDRPILDRSSRGRGARRREARRHEALSVTVAVDGRTTGGGALSFVRDAASSRRL